MNNLQLDECVTVLKRERKRIVEQLENKNIGTSDRFHTLSMFLRNLLVGEFPVLLRYAEHFRIPLIVWAPRSIPDGYLVGTNFHIASWTEKSLGSIAELYPISVENFLKIVVHITTDPVSGDSIRVTPERVIKWVANKEGNAHLDFKKPKGLISAKSWVGQNEDANDNAILLRRYIIQMAVWCVTAIDYALRKSAGSPDGGECA